MSDAKEKKEKVMLTKDVILKANDLPTKDVEVPEWGGKIRVRTMTGKERDEFESVLQRQTIGQKMELRGLKALLLSLTIIDEQADLVFGKEDLEKLNTKSSKVINQLFNVAQEMNGLGEEEVEELRKNSSGGQSVANGSG